MSGTRRVWILMHPDAVSCSGFVPGPLPPWKLRRDLGPDPEWAQGAGGDAQVLEQREGVVDGENVCAAQLVEVLVDDRCGGLLCRGVEVGLEDRPGVA